MRSSRYSGLNSVECMNSEDRGLFAFGVIGDDGDCAMEELKLAERSFGRLGDVGGRRNLKGTAVEELIRKGTIGLDGVMCSRGGDSASDGDGLNRAFSTWCVGSYESSGIVSFEKPTGTSGTVGDSVESLIFSAVSWLSFSSNEIWFCGDSIDFGA